MSLWEDAKKGEEGTIFGHQAQQMRTMSMVVQIKGNPMVKEAPTTKTYYLIENSATKLHIFVRNNTRDVPYCDSFQVIEEFLFLSPDPSSQPVIKSGIYRMCFHLQWLKSTLMKSIIQRNVDTETKTVFQAFVDGQIKAKKLTFVEKKAPVMKKGRSLMVESSLHLKKVADRERQKVKMEEEAKREEERKKAKELEAKRHNAEDWLEYLKLLAFDIGTEVQRYA